MESGKTQIHAMLDRLEEEINAEMTVMIRIDISDLQRQLHTVLESLTSLDCQKIDDIVNSALLALVGEELTEGLQEDGDI
ncbi:MAG: hypothetical protein ABRQ24_04615 [Syntrophomonadaceae bacterium]